MYMYFKTLRSVAGLDSTKVTSIRDLTIQLALEAGYRRERITLKNGKQVERTVYNDLNTRDDNGNVIEFKSAWNDVLVAKWFCYFEGLFRSKLQPHPELAEYYPFIIQRTFTVYMNALQIDRLKSDAMVVAAVNQSLGNRLGEAFCIIGSQARLDTYCKLKEDRKSKDEKIAEEAKKAKNRINMKQAFAHLTGSLDYLIDNKIVREQTLGTYTEIGTSDEVIDLKRILHKNPMGERVLEAMLNSDRKFNIRKINDFIELSDDEARSTSVLLHIKKAYLDILRYLEDTCESTAIREKIEDQLKFYSRPSVKFTYNEKTLHTSAVDCL